MQILIKRLDDRARLPERAHVADAGMDFFALEDTVLSPFEVVKVRTGVACLVPDGCVLLLWDKSSVGARGVKTFGGVIDAGYQGEIIVMLCNTTQHEIVFTKGQKIVQGLIQKVENIPICEVDVFPETKRGEGAFGSTGS